MTETLPPGYLSRPAQLDDVDAVLAIYHSVSLAMVGYIEETRDELLNDWQDPEMDLSRNSRIIFDATGEAVAFGIIYLMGNGEIIVLDVYLKADRWAVDNTSEPYLIRWALERAREQLASVPAEYRVAVRAWMHDHDVRYQAHLKQFGFAPIRYAFTMAISLDESPQTPVWPEGIRLHVVAEGEDWRPIFDVRRDSWRDHFGYIPVEYEQEYARWRHAWEPNFTPGLWFVALEGDQPVGICLCEPEQNGDASIGWVTTLGVRRSHRRKGIAMALLLHSFHVLGGMGKKTVELGVDGASLTGATLLYEQAGMHVKKRFDLYELELRPGIDPSTQTAGG